MASVRESASRSTRCFRAARQPHSCVQGTWSSRFKGSGSSIEINWLRSFAASPRVSRFASRVFATVAPSRRPLGWCAAMHFPAQAAAVIRATGTISSPHRIQTVPLQAIQIPTPTVSHPLRARRTLTPTPTLIPIASRPPRALRIPTPTASHPLRARRTPTLPNGFLVDSEAWSCWVAVPAGCRSIANRPNGRA